MWCTEWNDCSFKQALWSMLISDNSALILFTIQNQLNKKNLISIWSKDISSLIKKCVWCEANQRYLNYPRSSLELLDLSLGKPRHAGYALGQTQPNSRSYPLNSCIFKHIYKLISISGDPFGDLIGRPVIQYNTPQSLERKVRRCLLHHQYFVNLLLEYTGQGLVKEVSWMLTWWSLELSLMPSKHVMGVLSSLWSWVEHIWWWWLIELMV